MDASKNNLWKIGAVVGVLLAVFLLVLSIKEIKSIPYVGKDTPVMNAITVSGKGESISIPDIATFSFSVTETAKAVNEAQDAATKKMDAAIKALQDNGVEKKDIQTLSYTINPHYEYDRTGSICIAAGLSKIPCQPGMSVLTGYDVSQTIQVKVRDLTKAGSLFQTIGSLNVQNVNGLAFSIDDIEKVKAEAREIAILDAKEKAQKLSKQLGVKLVRISSFYDQSDEPVYPYYAKEMSISAGDSMVRNQAAPAPSIPTGEQKVTSRVSITYEIR